MLQRALPASYTRALAEAQRSAGRLQQGARGCPARGLAVLARFGFVPACVLALLMAAVAACKLIYACKKQNGPTVTLPTDVAVATQGDEDQV